MDKLIWQTFLNIGILLITGCSGSITKFPQNAAVRKGETAIFNCSSSIVVQGWYLSRDGTLTSPDNERITSYCNVTAGYTAHYSIEPLGGFQATCNLIVFDATPQQAGVYICSDGPNFAENGRALMTVIDSPPTITANQSDVVVGETLRLSCTVIYNGSVSPAPLLPPSIYWTSSTGENISSYLTPSPPPNSVESYILMKPDRSSNSIGPFTCHGYFGHPQNPANSTLNFATNAPTITHSTTSPVFNVYYEPTTQTTDFTDVCLLNSFTLVCNASANPPVDFIQWKESNTGVVLSNTSSVTISANGTYQCAAYNVIRNSSKESLSAPIEITVCKPITHVTLTGSNCTGDVCYCNDDGWVTLSCYAEGYPPPSYLWTNANDSSCSLNTSSATIKATFNGTYQCTATNEFNGTKYTVSDYITVTGCASSSPVPWICAVPLHEEPSPCGWQCGLIIGFVVYGFLNILAMIVFLPYYGLSENGHMRLNDRFDEMEKMLPCIKNKGVGCSGWVCLFVLPSIFVGIFYLPIIVIMANCEKSKKTSQGNSTQLNKRNVSEEETRQTSTTVREPSQDSSIAPALNTAPPTPPPPVYAAALSHLDQSNRSYPQSNTPQRPPTRMAGPYPQDPRSHGHNLQTSSPELSTSGIVYAELGIDNKPKSRKPVQSLQGEPTAYAAIGFA